MIRSIIAILVCVAARAAVAAPGVHYLYFVRHAIYDRDPKTTDDRVGNGINALGREQARLLAARLAALPVKLHALYVSDFKRAIDTAAELAGPLKLTPVVDPLLHECTPAPAANEPACEAQIAGAWVKYAKPTPAADTHDVLVSHGNVIRWLVVHALGADTKVWPALDIANASLTIIGISADGSAHLVMYSDASHVPIAKQTWAGPGAGWGTSKR
jgi:serine/threonine-protein phosphatase PGAM5